MLISRTVGRIALLALCVCALSEDVLIGRSLRILNANCLRDATVPLGMAGFETTSPADPSSGGRGKPGPVMILPTRLNVRATMRSRVPVRASARDASTYLPVYPVIK